jgi:predicted O-methyltransferase YrrM
MNIRTVVENSVCRVLHPYLSNSFRIPSHLTNRERLALSTLAATPGLKNIVEIGSYLGASAAAFGIGLTRAGNLEARVYCVDTWNNDAMTEGQRDTMGEFTRNTAAYGPLILPVRGWSTEVAAQIREHAQSIQLLFIDGDHSYEGCLGDWTAYRELLSSGAIVAFHDIGWADGVQEVVDQHVRPLVANQGRLPNLWWGTLR